MRSDVDDLKAFDEIKITVNGRCGAGDYVDDCEFECQANNGEWQYSEVPTVGEAYYGLIRLDWPDDEEAEALGPGLSNAIYEWRGGRWSLLRGSRVRLVEEART